MDNNYFVLEYNYDMKSEKRKGYILRNRNSTESSIQFFKEIASLLIKSFEGNGENSVVDIVWHGFHYKYANPSEILKKVFKFVGEDSIVRQVELT